MTRKGLRVLDIAGGSVFAARRFCAPRSSRKSRQLDWPNVNVAKKLNAKARIGGKIRFIDGEHRSASIETNYYDLILASNFCAGSDRPGQSGYFKAYAALKPGKPCRA